MKVKKVKLENFGKCTLEVEFNGSVTHLVGVNGAGKTTVGITAIWAALKGISEKAGKDGALVGERFRFIGPNKATADVEITLIDESKNNTEIKVKNHISKDANHITFEAPKGYPVNQSWLNNLLSVAFLSAKNFTALSSKEQALLLGIDVSSFDSEMKSLKDEYTIINREYRNIGEVVPVEKTEEVSVTELLKEKDALDQFNAAQEVKRQQVQRALERVNDLKDEQAALRKKLEEVTARITASKEYMIGLPDPEPLKDADAILEQVRNAEAINEKARKYTDFLNRSVTKEAKETELEENKRKQEALAAERVSFIQGFKFGFDGLSVGESGELLLDGRPLKDPYFSKGELELIVAKLYASKNPDLKVRFVDDFELLDDDNQENLLRELTAQGFQVITAEVGKSSEKENVILLRECKVVESYKEKL